MGYREIPETAASLKKIFKKVVEAESDEERNKALDVVQAGVHLIPSNRIPNIDWLILEAETNHVVVVNDSKYDVKL